MIEFILLRLVDLYIALILIYVLMSWLPMNSSLVRDIYNALGALCEPYLGLFRRIIPSIGGSGMSIDFSPIIAIIVLEVLARAIAVIL